MFWIIVILNYCLLFYSISRIIFQWYWSNNSKMIVSSTNTALNGLHYFQIMSTFILVDNDKLCFPIEIFPKKSNFCIKKCSLIFKAKRKLRCTKMNPCNSQQAHTHYQDNCNKSTWRKEIKKSTANLKACRVNPRWNILMINLNPIDI